MGTWPYGPGALDGGGGAPGGSSNQWFNPLPPSPQVSPGVVPPASTGRGYSDTGIPYEQGTMLTDPGQADFWRVNPLDPSFTQNFLQFLTSQMGKGATPFDLSALLPTGGETGAGQLTAPLNPLIQALMKFYQTGQPGETPGLGPLSEMSKTGMPVDQTPAWKAMVEAMQRQIGQGAEGMREQFAFTGNLASSPFGQAMGDYYGQTEKDINAQLMQAQTQALEAARARQMGASEFLATGMGNLSELLQGYDQASIDRLLAEFIRTRPEYGPLINAMFGMATTFPPYLGGSYGLGVGGALAGSAGSIMSGIADLYGTIRGGGGGSSGGIYTGAGGEVISGGDIGM